MTIRPIEPADAPAWEAMRRDMWPDDPESHANEIASFFAGTLTEPQAVLVAQEGTKLVAVAELSVRQGLDGLSGKRVGYVEGLYVVSSFRARGIARQLLRAARRWARENGCEAFASDRSDRAIIDRHF